MLFRLLIFCCMTSSCNVFYGQPKYLTNAHAHNDYRHSRPLRDALDHGFASIEVDVFLNKGKLMVSHTRPLIGKSTLEELYLKPLKAICDDKKGRIYDSASLILLVDIKTSGAGTYLALKELLKKYKEMLTTCQSGTIHPGAVTVILSGNKPYGEISGDTLRYAFLDRSLLNAEKDRYNNVHLMASTKYSNVLSWQGKGTVPESEKAKLIRLCTMAHQQKMKVRLWASPENEEVWKFLLECGVDLINTDELEKLTGFLTAK